MNPTTMTSTPLQTPRRCVASLPAGLQDELLVPTTTHQEKNCFGNLGAIWNPLRNLAILVGFGESEENWGKSVEIPWNPDKFRATVRESPEEPISDISVVVDASI
jgi:hypothetical protein